MKNVLIVDDEKSFLLSLTDGLKTCSEDFRVLTANNGEEAVEVLKSEKVHLVITDIKMPKMDGFELLAYLSLQHPTVPAIVMTAFGTPEMEDRISNIGSIHYLEKPLDINVLTNEINEALSAGDKGFIRGITLATFLQLLEMEKKTSALLVRSGKSVGYLFFVKGELIDAQTGSLNGEQAAFEIIGWDNTEIEMDRVRNKKKKMIQTPLNELLMEAYRIKDEANRDKKEGRDELDKLNASIDEGFSFQFAEGEPEENASTNKKEVNKVAAQDKLKEFASIEGFAGAGVFTPSGESLAMVASDGVNLNDIGVLANNVLMNAQKASLDMGTGRGQLVHIDAEKASIIVRCLNEGTDPLKSQPGKAHIHLVLVLTSDSSIGMAKMKIQKVIESLAEDFRL